MALSKTLTLQNNFGADTTLPNVYIKVFRVNGSAARVVAEVQLLSGPSGYLYKADAYEFAPDLDGPNFIKQAYSHLKTLPEFADATDC
jgi:hypothetical protein